MDEKTFNLTETDKKKLLKIIQDILNGLNLCLYQLDEVGRVGIRSIFIGPIGSKRRDTFNRAVLLIETVKESIDKLYSFSQKHPFSAIFSKDSEIIEIMNDLFKIDFYSIIEPLRRNKSARTVGLRIKGIYLNVKTVYNHLSS